MALSYPVGPVLATSPLRPLFSLMGLIGLVLAWAIAIRAPASHMSSHLDSQRARHVKPSA